MTLALGVLLGVGLLLTVSPFLWPSDGAGRPRRRRAATALRERLAQAGLADVSPAVLVSVSALTGAAVGALAVTVVPVLVLAFAAGLAGAVLPIAAVVWRARARRRATRVVWPDVVDTLVSSLRAGMSLGEGLAALGRSGPAPTRRAFLAFERDYRATGDFGAALDDLKERLADPVADRLLETVRMAREVGGTELTTVLRSLAGYLRADAALRSEVEARQSWTTNAARLGVAAPWIVLLLLATRPEAVRAYDSPAGATLLAVGFVLSVAAYRLMIALGRLPEERRWFA